MRFLSIENINLHKEYLRQLKLKLSVFDVSYPGVSDATYQNIAKLAKYRIIRREKREIFRLKSEIEAHEKFFSSFIDNESVCKPNEIILRQYGSEASFLYELLQYSRNRYGFLLVYLDRCARVKCYAGEDYINTMRYNDVALAVDLCEHAYLLDFGFDKEKYLSRALSSLNLSKLKPKSILQNIENNGKIE